MQALVFAHVAQWQSIRFTCGRSLVRNQPCAQSFKEKFMIILNFLEWYYKEIPKKFYRVWKNYLWFWTYYFSLKNLLKTFFSPWRKYSESYGRGFDLSRMASAFLWNTFSRLMGAIMRTFLILVSLIVEIFTILFGVLFFVLWPVFPLVLAAIFIIGIYII